MNNNCYDIIVIGAGFAGLSCAIEAKKSGASVVVLEKMKAAGGNSIISDGGMAIAGSPLQLKHNIEDSPEQFYQDMIKAGLGLNHPELVRTLTDKAVEAYLWLTEELGVKFMDRVDLFGGHSVARSHGAVNVSGASIINPMLNKLKDLNIPIKYGHVLSELIIENGQVQGVLISSGYNYKTNTGTQTFKMIARKGVVLAGGGFGSDVSFRKVQDPRLDEQIETTNKPFATAQLLIEALNKGAAPVQLSHIQLGPWASPDERGIGDGPLFADYTGFIYGMIVNPATGKRFINEQADRKRLSDAILAVGKPCLCISDDAAVKHTGWDIGKALNKGVVKTFSSLDSLAEYYSIPLESLSETVIDFNNNMNTEGDDRFGRQMPKDAKHLRYPPFYAMKVWPKVHYTMGGLQIDTSARVIDLHHKPIPGLYAAGEITGGIHGASRLGSCAITSCVVFGRIAGQQSSI
ncbi:MAG: flavocytochrome c [Spirochaetia bacterium]|jgi:flavocytochrome c|nr:flavocytochrome c [Spirochaetia bacterium]